MSQILGYSAPISGEQLATLKDKGYLPDDLIGKAGLEAEYETELRGTYGSQSVEQDASGRQTQVLQTVTPAAAGRLPAPDHRYHRPSSKPRRHSPGR